MTLAVGTALIVPGPVGAASPFPFFRQVGQIGLLCVLDGMEPGLTLPEPVADVAGLCRLAARELTGLLARAEGGTQTGAPPVVVLSRNDERLADPQTLTILLHGNLGRKTVPVLALSATLYRSRPDFGSPPFFIPPPEALAAPNGLFQPEEIREALGRLMSGIARPLLTNR